MGESYGPWVMGLDAEVMPYIDMANIACGFHASDPQIMDKTVKLAVQHNVSIGAHPGYPDLLGFGRRNIHFSDAEITNMVLYQVGALQAICKANGVRVDYIKPHGALYNTMMVDARVMNAVFKAVELIGPDVALMLMADANHELYREKAAVKNISLLFEAFCDRAYTDKGTLAPRNEKGAVLSDIDAIHHQVEELIHKKQIKTVSGNYINVDADTVCVHGDNQFALDAVRKIRKSIDML